FDEQPVGQRADLGCHECDLPPGKPFPPAPGHIELTLIVGFARRPRGSTQRPRGAHIRPAAKDVKGGGQEFPPAGVGGRRGGQSDRPRSSGPEETPPPPRPSRPPDRSVPRRSARTIAPHAAWPAPPSPGPPWRRGKPSRPAARSAGRSVPAGGRHRHAR